MSNQPEDRLSRAFETARTAAQRVPDDEQRARARARFLLEAKSVSLNGDMRLRDQTGALSDVSESTTGEPRMKRIYSKRARLIAAVLLGVILAGGFWATPSLRTLAQEILEYFIPAETDTQPSTVYVGDSDPDAPGGVYVDPYQLSLDEVVARADFDVRLPTYMPDIMHLKGALLSVDSQRVEMIFDCTPPWSLLITQWNIDMTPPPLEVGASAIIEDVPIRDVIGQYVRGMWRYEVDPDIMATQSATVGEIPATRVWTNDGPWQWLVWREDGINFIITTAGGIMNNDTVSPCALTKDDYVAIAEGLQPASTVQP